MKKIIILLLISIPVLVHAQVLTGLKMNSCFLYKDLVSRGYINSSGVHPTINKGYFICDTAKPKNQIEKKHVHQACTKNCPPRNGFSDAVGYFQKISETQAIRYGLVYLYCPICKQWYNKKINVDTIPASRLPIVPREWYPQDSVRFKNGTAQRRNLWTLTWLRNPFLGEVSNEVDEKCNYTPTRH